MSQPFLVRPEQVEALEAVRERIERLRGVAREIDPDGPSAETLDTLLRHLDETFLVVIVGEVKSGKSTLVNTLLRADVCAVGPTPVTDRINILRYGDEDETQETEAYVVERRVPSERLRGLAIVDTPGTNSIVRRHEEITRDFLPRADLVLFVTSSDRPYSESENAFLHLISDRWRRKIVFVLTKADIKEPAEVEEILAYVRQCCVDQLGFEPLILPVATKDARAALEAGDDEAWERAGLAELERRVLERLDDDEKTRLRILGQIDGARATVDGLRSALQAAAGLLADDYRHVSDLEAQTNQKRVDLSRQRHVHLTRLAEAFEQLRERGDAFLDDRFKVTAWFRAGGRAALETRFRNEVVGDLQERLTRLFEESVEWLAEESRRFHHDALAFFAERVAATRHRDRLVERPVTAFEERRDGLIDRIGAESRDHVAAFDVDEQSREVFESARRGLGYSASGVGAGLVAGTVVAMLSSLWWSVVAIPFFAVGWLALGAIRARVQRNWAGRVGLLERKVRTSLAEALDAEIDRTATGVRKIWAPYLAFFEAETARMEEQGEVVESVDRELADRRAAITEAGPGQI